MQASNFSREKVRAFIESNMNIFDDDIELEDDANIFENGYVNSIFAMRLVTFIEKEFDVEIPDDDIILSNFHSVISMEKLVVRLQESCHA